MHLTRNFTSGKEEGVKAQKRYVERRLTPHDGKRTDRGVDRLVQCFLREAAAENAGAGRRRRGILAMRKGMRS